MRDGKFVILYVDDDPDYLVSVRPILESGGYIMVEADSAESGLRVFEREAPDLVLVDLMMEEVDAGTGLVKDLRARGSKVPIYLLSSAGDGMSMTVDTVGLGLAGTFQKPVEPRILLSVLGARLRG